MRRRLQVMLARHRATGREYAIKVLDKGHLKRNNKLATALAEKNTLVRLGAEHPGIVHLHWTFNGGKVFDSGVLICSLSTR